MGQTLSEPVTEKHSATGEDERYIYGVSEMQGWRIGMEDAHTNVLELGEGDRNAFFAVYDGHGGVSAAKFAGTNVHKRLISEEAYAKKDYKAALKRAFLGTDEDLRADSNFFRDPSGCTAVTTLITTDGTIYCANAGDSRSVLGVKGEAKPLSFDHKPQNEGESSRIRAAGGYVEYGRVNGNLALSRAIGDFEFKQNHSLEPEKQIVTSDPEITVHEPTEDDEFLVLACDGIWDCLTSQQVIDICRREIANRKELKEIAEIVIDKCLAPDSDINGGVGCDNMTMAIVAFLHGRTKAEWYDWMVDRVERSVGYATPKDLPMIYSPARISAAKERWSRGNSGFGGGGGGLHSGGGAGSFTRAGASGFGALARVFGSNITFHPSGGISGKDFENDDSDEEYESGEEETDIPGALKAPPHKDINKSLRAQLEELKDEDKLDGGEGKMVGSYAPGKWTIDDDGDSAMVDGTAADPVPPLARSAIWSRRVTKSGQVSENGGDDSGDDDGKEKIPIGLASEPPKSIGSPLVPSPRSISTAPGEKGKLQGEAPPPPKVNGTSAPVEQLKSTPGGDAPSDAVKAEGLMDKSEDPLVAA
ncbi:Protein phosphatase 2C 2 [Tulasnella sp. JGI-2019a]|nr:Protein phosphatase 2C 2 [Tulasnella sp. JGI-2019a]KAG9008777.1 Protein phosphatase 2C 2 [Tulasnella sp. JGI-2019a]KAG9033966.1 Protein phosphatase 2C 2 [Tulasnella sp. JGI-2019a]